MFAHPAESAPPSLFESQRVLIQHQATRLIGQKVEDNDGQQLGALQDIVIDAGSDRVIYVIIKSRAWFGLVSAARIVAAPALSTATTKSGILVLNIPRARFQSAASFKKKDLQRYADKTRMAALYSFSSLPLPAGATPQKFLFLATGVMNSKVLNTRRESIGHVRDLLVDLTQTKPVVAVISAERMRNRFESFAVPLYALNFSGRDEATMNADRALFERAGLFTDASWQAGSNRQTWALLYPLRAANNTGRNARDISATALTPFKQSEKQTDRAITQKIRTHLIHEPRLSFTARNAKIITVNGKVTLRGPVKTESERAVIGRRAEEIAGTNNVDNQLEVDVQ